MQIATFLANYTGKTVAELYEGADGPLVEPHMHLDGTCSFPIWRVEDKDPPTSEEIIAALAAPEPAASPLPVVLYRADLYRRCTDDEADAIDAALANQPTRIRRIFESAVTFRSDDEMWSLLHDAAVGLFDDKRAAVLLSASAP